MLRQGLDKIFSVSDSSFDDLGSIGEIVSLSNASIIAKVISDRLDGVSPTLIEFLTAIMAKDMRGIFASVAKIQEEIGIGKELLDCIVTMAISDFDPSDDLKQASFGQLQLIIKKIFRVLDPFMPYHESISVLCNLILDRDPSPMV